MVTSSGVMRDESAGAQYTRAFLCARKTDGVMIITSNITNSSRLCIEWVIVALSDNTHHIVRQRYNYPLDTQ
ncbi:MAG: hypothetical protein E7K68_04350, partial [Corynebacterium kroppenstedtii]|nr:hypothetical protein [Corynebacterium kroppenstedtii]